jgi:Na+/melibiose symporter-like transporter
VLPPWRLMLYAGPSMSLNVMVVPLLLLLPQFYSADMGMDLATIGTVFMVARFWDAFTDPTIGALSDRIRTRWGRRRPLIVIGLPLVMGATWFLLNPPANVSFGYLLTWVFLFYVFWTLIFIPYHSWGTELATGFHERTRVAGYRDGASFAGYLLAAVLPLVILQVYLRIEEPSYAQMLNVLGAFFLISLPITVSLCFIAVPEPPPAGQRNIPWRELLSILRRNRPFVRLLTAYLLDRTAMGVYFAAMPLAVSFALGMFEHFLTFSVVISVSSLLFSPGWVRLTARLGKHPAYCWANGVTALGYGLFLVVPAENFWAVLAIFTILGVGNAGTLITAPSMMADCVDYDRLKSGVEQTGAHMAFLWLMTKIGFALGIGIGLKWFLPLFDFNPGDPQHTAQQLAAVRFATGGLPMLLLVPAVLLMLKFPLSARRHAVIRRRLDRNDARAASR